MFSIDGTQPIDVGRSQRIIAGELGRAGEASEGFSIVWIGEKNLLPGLGSHVHAAARFERLGLIQQRLGRGLRAGRRNLSVDRHREGRSQGKRRPQGCFQPHRSSSETPAS
jgi:hypothetical protein